VGQLLIAPSFIVIYCFWTTKRCADSLNYEIPGGDAHCPNHTLRDDLSMTACASGIPTSRLKPLELAWAPFDWLQPFMPDPITTKGLSSGIVELYSA
jgi:hypothetical protein